MSDLANAIAARPRPAYGFPVADYFGLGDRKIHGVGIRLAVKSEDDAAIVAAHGYALSAAKAAGEAAEAARKDADLLGDAKTIEALFRICREVVAAPGVTDPRAGVLEDWVEGNARGSMPGNAFPTPKWMRDHLTTDQIAVLLNLYIEVKRTNGPAPLVLDDEHIEGLVALSASHPYTNMPEAALAPYPREYLTHAFVFIAQKLVEQRAAVDALLAERDALEAQLAVLRMPPVNEVRPSPVAPPEEDEPT